MKQICVMLDRFYWFTMEDKFNIPVCIIIVILAIIAVNVW